MKHETAPAPAIIAGLTNEQLLKVWEATEFLSTSPETAITRGWIMDELEKRNPSAFNAWLDSESPEDSTLRRYFTANPICYTCRNLGRDCNGTENKAFTGCIYRKEHTTCF